MEKLFSFYPEVKIFPSIKIIQYQKNLRYIIVRWL